MFPSQRHFASLPCPLLPRCSRPYCPFSHARSAPPPFKRQRTKDNARQQTESSEMASAQQLARSPPVLAAKPTPASRLTRPQGATGSSAIRPGASSAAAERGPAVAPTRPKLSVTPVQMQPSSFNGKQGIAPRLSSSAPVSSPSRSSPSRPQPQVQSPQAPAKPTGPPVLLADVRSHSSPKVRQLIATKFYDEFLRIYTPHALSSDPTLATTHALLQERAVHAASATATYKNLAANTLTRLKRRQPARDAADVGIDGEYDPSAAGGTGDAVGARGAQKFGSDATYPLRAQDIAQYILTVAQMEEMGYPIRVTPEGVVQPEEDEGAKRTCDRCGKEYVVRAVLGEGDLVACSYHYGRVIMGRVDGEKQRFYSCCRSRPGEAGCTTGPHVFKEETIAELERRASFIQAPPASDRAIRGATQVHDVVALDCEMCYTTAGLELARLTVLNGHDGSTLLDELVLPRGGAVVDLNTRFSGIVTFRGAKYNFKDVIEKFFEYVDGGTIIVGQSLENDFKVMRLVHHNVVDTAALYPHPSGLPYRHSLRTLANRYLKRFIQEGSEGHDSAEDARACLELLALKIKKGTYGLSLGFLHCVVLGEVGVCGADSWAFLVFCRAVVRDHQYDSVRRDGREGKEWRLHWLRDRDLTKDLVLCSDGRIVP